ncbi:MAG: DUF4214 domain-containing protein, partial [Anaerolineae bacterium]|nr:DUF4214 domain-containing protein [Anaerolineae bacterium]
FAAEHNDEAFVQAVYEAILHRPPSPDDLKFRLEELSNGKDRESFFMEIFNASEHQAGHLYQLSYYLKNLENS